MKKILDSVIKKITPTEKEKKDTQKFIQSVLLVSKRIVETDGLKQVLSGSYIRDTWMTNKKEFDLFILFPENTTREELEKNGIEVGKKITTKLKGEFKIAYAEHPYVRAKIGAYDIDIVPCYNLKSADKIKSAVDRTPFHNKWLSRNLDPKLSSQVRLLKKFTKTLEIYGSDTKTSGLSGYLCELLIIHHGSFEKFVKAASKWEPGKVLINMKGDMEKPILKNFREQPLVLIDPVDNKRNVAAAFSPENFMKLVYYSKEFVKKPSINFFFRSHVRFNPKVLEKRIRERETKIIGIKFSRPDIIDDTLWPQLRKTTKRISDILEDAEFNVLNSEAFTDEKNCILLFELGVWKLPQVRKLTGPSIFISDRASQFVNKYSPGRVWVEESNFVAEIKRKFTEAEDKIVYSLSASATKLRAKGIASYVATSMAKKKNFISYKQLILEAKKNKELAEFLTNFFEKRVFK